MKALYYDELKGYKGVKIGDSPVPEIHENDVLVRVKVFSLHHLAVDPTSVSSGWRNLVGINKEAA